MYYYSGYRKTAPSTKSLGVLDVKPEPAPNVPGNTEAERFSNAVSKVLTVSKADLLKAEANWKRSRARKQRAKKTT